MSFTRAHFICTARVSLRYLCLIMVLGTAACLSPVATDSDAGWLQLSLEKLGIKKAIYSGEPIIAFLTIRDSARYSDIVWHGGKAKHGNPVNVETGLPVTDYNRYIHSLSVELFWTELPSPMDSNGNFFDTIYASMGGQIRSSNTVRVVVANLAPVLDSIYVDSTGYDQAVDLHPDSAIVWEVGNMDSVLLRVKAHDADDRILRVSFSGGTRGILLADETQERKDAVYVTPNDFFTDTIRITVYDSNGGQVVRAVVLQRVMPNYAPGLDSLVVNGSNLRLSKGVYRYVSVAFDTVRINVFAHDSNGDALTTEWTVKHGTFSDTAANSLRRTYTSDDTTTGDTLEGLMVPLDTLGIRIADVVDASLQLTIIIAHGSPNELPEIDSLYLGPVGHVVTGKAIPYTMAPSAAVSLRAIAHDLDPRDSVLSYHWICLDTTRLSLHKGDSSFYTAGDAVYTDTLLLAVADTKLGTDTARVYIAVNEPPVIDSISAELGGNETLFILPDHVFDYTASTDEQVAFKVFASDGAAADVLTYQWTVRGKGKVTPVPGTPSEATYLAPAAAGTDSLIVSVKDAPGATSVDTVVVTVN